MHILFSLTWRKFKNSKKQWQFNEFLMNLFSLKPNLYYFMLRRKDDSNCDILNFSNINFYTFSVKHFAQTFSSTCSKESTKSLRLLPPKANSIIINEYRSQLIWHLFLLQSCYSILLYVTQVELLSLSSTENWIIH